MSISSMHWRAPPGRGPTGTGRGERARRPDCGCRCAYGGQHARASHAAGGCVISAMTAGTDRGAAAQPWGGLPIFISARSAARS
jgi:hypothetical protein